MNISIQYRGVTGRGWFWRGFALAVWLGGAGGGWAQSVVVTPLTNFPNALTVADSLFLGKVDGALYGTTYGDNTNGTIFTVNRDGTGYAVLHAFAAQELLESRTEFVPGGSIAFPSVMQGRDGALYGTTPAGGTNGTGTVFRATANGSFYSVLHSFSLNGDGHPTGLMQGSDGALYGVAGNDVFKINTDGGGYRVLYSFNNDSDGSDPLCPLLQGNDGFLYGAAYTGGSNGLGTVFKLDTNGSNFMVLHTFGSGTDGQNPVAGLIQGSSGALFGTTFFGGPGNNGTIFKLNTDGGGYAMIHPFAGRPASDGEGPLGNLVEGLDGVLYGTTELGGNNISGSGNFGTIFKIGQDGNGYSVILMLASAGPIGRNPISSLARGLSLGDSGVLYGTTSAPGVGGGSIFAILMNPPLSITPVTSQVLSNQTVIFWPAFAVNYTLQSTTNPAGSNWANVNVSSGVPVTGLQVTSTNAGTFYRLVSP